MISIRGLARAAFIVPLTLLGITMLNLFHIWTYSTKTTPSTPITTCPVATAEILLVMGAAQYDGTPSPAFQRRLDKAHELYEANCATQIVVTGGKQAGDRTTEGETGVAYLENLGVPATDLAAETQSTTSFTNLSNSLPYVVNKRVIIVTDDMHSYRTLWLSKHIGIDATVVPVKTRHEKLRYGLRELYILTAYELGIIR